METTELEEAEKLRLQRAEEIVRKVWSHMCGYDLDGTQRNPIDDSDTCMRNWQKLHDMVAEHILRSEEQEQ